ncbi:MAG: O-antigen ligase family protein, partial [Flavobacteriales bacterium]|nr:O-antigen ligase family protein [Flavobacteriales bacterium]
WLLSRLIPIIAIYCLMRHKNAFWENIKILKKDLFFLASIIVVISTLIFSIIRNDDFTVGRTIFTCLVYISVIPWNKIKPSLIASTFILGGLITGGTAVFDYFILNHERVGTVTNPIPFATFCASLSLINLYIGLNVKNSFIKNFAYISFILSFFAMILSGTRGVILFYPFIIGYLIFPYLKAEKKPLKKSLVVIISLILIYFSAPILEERIKFTMFEISALSGHNFSGSFGNRLSLWNNGLMLDLEQVFFGIGDIATLDRLKTDFSHWPFFSHYHNQFIDNYVKYGLIMTLFFVAWSFSPLLINISFPIVLAIIITFTTASLTDVPFLHSHLVYFFTLTMFLFSSLNKLNK